MDEVMTGFRLGLGGAQALYGIHPDLTTLGKIIGGGMPVGAYGGRNEIMNLVAPLGPMYQAGTLSGNPLAMAAGLATLCHLRKHPEIYTQIEKNSSLLVEGILQVARKKRIPMQANRMGSMFTWFFCDRPVTDWESAAKSDTRKFAAFHRAMLEQGIYLPPSQFEAAFMSTAHKEADVWATVQAADKALV
jgi:glutamate-1-semialdehyde 2,1-aminomutase